MKKLVLSTLIVVLGTAASYAQQIPLYSNYFFTPYIYNPALSGAEGVTNMSFLHRRQWSDVQGAPETSALAMNGSLNEEKVGWSVYAFSDETDIVERFGFYGNYAYHLQLADNTSLSFGLGAGYLRNSINLSAIRARDAEPLTAISNSDRGTFDVNAGLNLKIADFSLGFAAPQLLGQSIEYSTDFNQPVNYNLIRHYVVSAGYDFKFAGDKMVLSPQAMIRAAKNVPVQIDAGVLFNMTEIGYLGAMFRSDYAVTLNVGVNLTEAVTFGYAHDFSTNDYGPSLGTSNEFMLTYRFGSNKRNERLENEIKRMKKRQKSESEKAEEMMDQKLQEFKDENMRDIKAQSEEAAKAAAEKAVSEVKTQLEEQNNSSNNNQNGGANNNPNVVGPVPDGGGNQNKGNQNNGQIGQSHGGQAQSGQNGSDYNPSNLASNVTPGSKGYYVVAGVFSNQKNAQKLINKLASEGATTRFFQDSENFYYYVYLLKFDSYSQANQAKSSNLNGTFNGELWIKVVN